MIEFDKKFFFFFVKPKGPIQLLFFSLLTNIRIFCHLWEKNILLYMNRA